VSLWTTGTRRRCAFGIGLLSCLFAAGCAAFGGAASELRVTLEVQDGWVREPGEDCSGSRPYLYVHRGGDYQIEEARTGEMVDSGSLPGGTAVEAYNEDLEVSRVPTFCRFRLSVPLARDGEYRLVLAEGDPLTFSVDGSRDPILVTIP
jgi:hypothetical protein